jgi:hypothetical protein
MLDEPPVKRAVAFVDGQNLYHAVRQAFAQPTTRVSIGATTAQSGLPENDREAIGVRGRARASVDCVPSVPAAKCPATAGA